MASTMVKSVSIPQCHPYVETVQRRSSLTAGLDENIAHGGPTGVKPYRVWSETVVAPTSNDVVGFYHIEASDSTTNDTVHVRWDTTAGGSLTGTEVELHCMFAATKSGGIG
jgi:hypothetical protein